LRFAIKVSVGRHGSSVSPLQYQPSRPRIIPRLIGTFGAYEARKISERPYFFRDSQDNDFLDLLRDPRRSLPVVYVSVTNQGHRAVADPLQLANWLAGVAYVVRAESPWLSWRLSEKIGPGLNAYDGAVRIYWPKLLT